MNNIKNSRVSCSDDNNILGHFSGYFEKKELWDYWKNHPVEHHIFLKVVKGEYQDYLRDRKSIKNIDDAWR